MKTSELTCKSWLGGKHGNDVEINTSIPYISIGDFFSQGQEADNIINEINIIYNNVDCSVLEACDIWAERYL